MKRNPLVLTLTLLTLPFFLSANLACAATKVPASDRHLQYSGRIDFSSPSAPVLSWPQSSVAANFTGSSLAITLDDKSGANYFNVILDGDDAHPVIVRARQGSKTYEVASGLALGKHSFLITKRTEGQEGETVFLGVELANNGQLLRPSPRPLRRIEFFGDSVTSGMGNEAPINGVDALAREKNSYLSYAAITARALNAELHMTSQSGIGIMASYVPFTIWDFYDQLNAVGNNDSRWDFSAWTPDVVVINLMQNDSSLIGQLHKLQPEPDDEQRVASYMKFVKRIRQLYPKAYIVCALGSMDATKTGSPWPGYVKSAVDQIRFEDNDARVDTLFFPFTGYSQHPRLMQHKMNADRLTSFIKMKLGW